MQQETAETFAKAFDSYADELFRHASLRLSNRERALEIVQEAFLKAWQYVSRGEEVRDMRAFLYRTLRNLIIDEYRKHKSVSLDDMLETDDGSQMESMLLADDEDALENAFVRFDASRALEAVRALPEPYREVIVLRYIDSLSIAEVAERIGESENVVSVRIHRGLKKLRSLMEDTE